MKITNNLSTFVDAITASFRRNFNVLNAYF